MVENEQIPSKEKKELEEEEEIISISQEGIINLNKEDQKDNIMCHFIIKQIIGEGTFATVRLAVNKQTGMQVAIKIMEKNKIVEKRDKVRIEREIKVLKNLRHPNIVHLYNAIQTEEKIYLIMEYVKGRELFDYIVMKKKLSEYESCLFFQQIISGIEYLHKIKYVHRDIKPENLLINEETKELKIVDFGLSNIYTNPNKHLLSSACGSPSYAPPEMLTGEKYKAQPVDIWSSGVVLYAMLCGYLPFEDDDNEVLYEKIRKGKFTIPNHVSEKARDLLNKILVTNPKKRLTIFQIKQHPWFSLYNDKGKLMISDGLILSKYVEPIDEEIVTSMSKSFNIIEEKIRISILSNKHDNISTIYYLLLHKKINNKKKSVADIKSDLFKKYCENKYNLFENYDKELNKVLEDRKNGYLNNLQNLSHNKVLSSNFSEIKRKLNTLDINEQNSLAINNNEEIRNNDKNIDIDKRSKFLSPDSKGTKLYYINNSSNKTSNSKEKPKITKYNTNKNSFKSKNLKLTKEENNKNIINFSNGENEINSLEKKNNIIEELKINENGLKNNNREENNENRNFVKYREKKVHYENKKFKNINYIKKKSNQKASSRNKNQNELQNSINTFNNNKNDVQKNRIKSARVGNNADKKNNIKEKNDLNLKDLKKSVHYELLPTQKTKTKNHIKSKSIYTEVNADKNNIINNNNKLQKINTFKTPRKSYINSYNNSKINIKSKILSSLDKNKSNKFSEKGEKKINLLNQTVAIPKVNKELLFGDSSINLKQKLNTIYEKKEMIFKNINKNEDKSKLSFHPNNNNNLSQDISNIFLEKENSKKLNYFSSYNKKPQHKLRKSLDINNEKIIKNKISLFRRNILPNLEMKTNSFYNTSISKMDEDSLHITNKKLNCYEPFDLHMAFIKPRKTVKEQFTNLLDKSKIKYRNISNIRYIVELKKEDVSLEIKFDKLNYIKDNIDEVDNSIRISIIKLRILNGDYHSGIKSFEKIIFKLN